MKTSKLAPPLNRFMASYYNHFGLISPKLLAEAIKSNLDTKSFKQLFDLLSKDRAQVVETLQKSISINKVFAKIRNDFVDDFLKELRDINHVQEEQKTIKELANKITRFKNKEKIDKLMSDLELSDRQKEILKSVLEIV